MKFFTWLHKQSLFIHYLTIIIVIVGIMALLGIQREARPNVNFNRVAVSVAYPGASPSDVEELIIDPIEEKIAEVDGVKEYRSVSFSGAGAISVEIDDTYPDVDEIIDEIRRKVGEVKGLPDEVEDPFVTEIKAVNIPILRLAVYGDLPPLEMKYEVERLKDYLSRFPGVQNVSYTGLTDLQLKILADPQRLAQYDMTLLEMIQSLASWSRQKPGGLFENDQEAANITIGEDYNTIEKLRTFVLRANDSNLGVSLAEVADVRFDTETSQQVSTFEGQNATLITIVKKPSADIVNTVETIKKSLVSYEKNLPASLKYKLYTDESVRVRSQLKTVAQNAGFGMLLVLIVLIINLDWRSAMVTSLGIPVAILGGIALLYFQGATMNTLVLIGMIVVLGMLVDDAIVVCENIYSNLERGLSPTQAAIKGVSEIAIPVVATVLTTIFAFSPILLMKGIMGQFISVIPLTVILMLIVSLFEALIILPIHAHEIMRPKKAKKSFFKGFESVYRRYLNWSVNHRWLSILALLLVFVASAFQGKILFSKFTLFPATGLTGVSVRVEVARNTPIDQTAGMVNVLSQRLEAISGGDFESLYANVGQVTTGGAGGSRQNGSHLAAISIVFTSDPDFIDREKDVLAKIRQVSREFGQEFQASTTVTISRPGPPVGKPIQFQITSRDFSEARLIADELKKGFQTIQGVHSIETDADGDTKSYRIKIDNNLAVSEGVNPSNISRTIFAASTGVVTSEILRNNDKVEILVGIKASGEATIADILKLRVRNKVGQAVPIAVFAKAVVEKGPSSIQRLDGVKTLTLFGEVDEKVISGKEANDKIQPKLSQIRDRFPNANIATGGGEKERVDALKDTFRLYGLAIILIFMVISLSFQSVIYPFLVLIAIPFGLVGVVWSLSLHDTPLSLMGMVGVVGLSGVVVNVSIILLSFIQQELRDGMDLKEAVINAGVRRLRPIVITTLTTLIGLLPSIYGVGGVDPFVQPLSLVLGWGLAFATALSVLFLPSLISFFTIIARKVKER
ncbi:efflux RND transporter permease subunit [Pseudobacteriovorax antillogorgiicola]|uniref:Multidrug efflux pump subunit AcrB n=1 Tax=Pseudobacteriovorax antillogorgiicola TaxID=1513793 RepID=A0A1Y6C328_9BACT|nr:efflux RND transporter permease subunit [Pseudobacteriovorax antillogorgiicola]TCS49824.1 multidrug efflux pump subunit AcrB [Pseudobacteriovorax antillogorgiicola]SMF43303.1 Multidrug efflux pump subunit AcrB [Pseudobacteriovorax antillogorgiicola]